MSKRPLWVIFHVFKVYVDVLPNVSEMPPIITVPYELERAAKKKQKIKIRMLFEYYLTIRY